MLGVLTSVGEKHQTMDKQQAAFSLCLPLTICTLCMCVCVVFTKSIKIHEISSRALFGPGKVRPDSFQIS